MFLKKEHLPIMIPHALVIILFSALFIIRENYEFLSYVALLIFFTWLILYTDKRVNYPPSVLWGLFIWSTLHIAGGGIIVGSGRLYDVMLLPLVGEPYLIFKYDQFVHILGFFVATLVSYAVLKPHLKKAHAWTGISVIVIMAGLGFGAVNEIVEFAMTVIWPDTGVGGYVNTSLDLVADLIGAIAAMIFIRSRK